MVDAVERPDTGGPYIFVSYASVDRERVTPVVAALQRAGIAVWLDQHSIAGGENYAREIAEGIEHAAALVLMCSAASMASRNVRQEVGLAWKYERPYLPLLLEAVVIPKEIEYFLEMAQWIEVRDRPERDWLPDVLAALAPMGVIPAVATDAPPLAGREREQALLRRRLDAARAGNGGIALIGGEAGIGKTTLAEAMLREAERRGAFVLEGHCFDLAETPPYGPWIDLFAHLPVMPSPLPPVPDAFAVRGTVGAVASQMALFVAVEDFLRALAGQRPVVVLLDDLHWADPASLDLLRFLTRSVATLPLLLLATYRSDELTRHHPLYQILPQLAREAGGERIDLGRLNDAAVRTLVAARYGLADDDASRLVVYLQSRAEGNALFIGELLRSLEETGTMQHDPVGWVLGALDQTTVPPLLRQVIDGRVGRLDAEAQRLLAVAAVIGHEVPLAVWAIAGEVDEETILAAAEHGLDAQVLVETAGGERVRFAHALIRETLYEGVPSIRRRRLHRGIGEALAAVPNADPDAVAMHFQRANNHRAVPWLVKAGERAQLAYAWLTAAERYEAALAVLDTIDGDPGERGWLLYRIARLRRISDPRQGIEYLDEALRIADAVGDRALTAAARYSRGLCLSYDSDYDAAIRDMAAGCDALEALSADDQERLDLGPDANDLPTVTNPRGFLVAILAGCGRIAEAIAMGEATREGMPRRTPLGELGWAHHGDRYAGLGDAYALAGRPTEARDAFARARDTFRASGNYSTLSGVTTVEILHLRLPYFTERTDEHRRLADEATAARVLTSVTGARDLSLARIPVLALTGPWSDAREEAEAALGSGLAALWYNFVATTLSELAHRQGEPETAWMHIGAILPSGARTVPGSVALSVGLGLLRLASALSLDVDDLATAKEWLDAHDRWLAWSDAVRGQSEGQALWARYHRQAGDIEQTREHAENALAHATEPRQPLALLAAHRLLGALDTEAGRFADAETHLQSSLALADACAAPYERALTLLAMAELRAATGETARPVSCSMKPGASASRSARNRRWPGSMPLRRRSRYSVSP